VWKDAYGMKPSLDRFERYLARLHARWPALLSDLKEYVRITPLYQATLSDFVDRVCDARSASTRAMP
jgi:hypothetical protein